MCGIVGLVAEPDSRDLTEIDAMMSTLAHRGPDDAGSAVLAPEGVALGMRRLSILDIEGGSQPMWGRDQATCLVFNGEIYNFAELREELQRRGHQFDTRTSDTEVLVRGYTEWSTGLFEKLNGMFAVAIWDRAKRQLIVARDRFGEKPLYIARLPTGFAIASELKAFYAMHDFTARIDLTALEQYFAFSYVLGARTILEGVSQLAGGEYAVITPGSCERFKFWAPPVTDGTPIDDREMLERFDALLDDAVRRRMVADVPVGLFLSGGLDSTTVGYFMRRHHDDVQSFSIGFDDPRFDESSYAALAAKSLGTEHHVEVFSQDKILELIPRVSEILDQPMGDKSIFPTYLLSRFTRQSVKVALGGDGSDELLLGYRAYKPLKVAWMLDRVPRVVRRAVAQTSRNLPDYIGSTPLRGVGFARHLDLDPRDRAVSFIGGGFRQAEGLFNPELRASLPRSVFPPSPSWTVGATDLPPDVATVIGYMRGFLQEDILVKVDRASMAASLEVRSAVLDPELVNFILASPTRIRMPRMRSKDMLRRLMRGRIPDEIIDRRKMGFELPLHRWLRESLAPLVRSYLDPSRIASAGILDATTVQRIVDEHLSGQKDRGHEVWLLLQFELWRERWLP